MTSNGSDQSSLDARVDKVFDRALDLPSAERGAYLAEVCDGDEALRARVERLLGFCDDPPSLLDDGVATGLLQLGDDPEPVAEPDMPARVGPFQVLQEIGRGGMGVVYLAMRADGHFEQQVAVKVTRPEADTAEARRRFEQERQIIASLQHANIARLYDGGVTEDGRPYSAMELVDGKPITVYCDEHRLSVDQRLRLVEVVGSAVHYAHRSLVVHCDLKPSNILVTPNGEIKLLDFGIAKLLGAAAASTDSSRAITPLYASPEQLRGESVTTASDIYQLGLLLFELLTGERARNSTMSAMPKLNQLAESTHQRTPSSVVLESRERQANAIAAARNTRTRQLARALRKDLDLIFHKATHPQPLERYLSAGDLVEDLKRHRRHQPLAVRQGTFGYRAGRFVRRNRVSVAGVALLLLLLIAYAITVTTQAQRIARERDRAQRTQAFALGLFGAGDPSRVLESQLSAAELVAHGVSRAEAELGDEPDIQADVKAYLGKVYMRLGLFDQAEPLFREVLALRRQLHDRPDLEIAAAETALARLLQESDDPETLPLLESALEQRRQLLGDDHPLTAQILNDLGFYLRSTSRYLEAEERFREALGRMRASNPDDVAISRPLRGLAWTLWQLGRPEEAEPLAEEALSILRQHHGDRHPEVAKGWNDLANVLWQLERWEEGDTAIWQSIETKKELFGEAHPSVATSLGNLAGSQRRRGDLEGAAMLYRQAMELRQEALGPRHPRVAQSTAQLAEVLHESGQLTQAEPLFADALSMFREQLAEDHPSLARVRLGQGTMWLDAGKLDEARQTLNQARAHYSGQESSPWPWRIDVMLAEIDLQEGHLESASEHLKSAEKKLQSPEWIERWREATAKLSSD